MNSPALFVIKQNSGKTDLANLTLQACELAKEAASHAIDGLINGAASSLEAVRSCEQALDELAKMSGTGFDGMLVRLLLRELKSERTPSSKETF